MLICYVKDFFFFKQKTAYEMRISDWSSDVCSSDLLPVGIAVRKDRLRRAAAMIVDHATRFCDALSEDFGHRSREQSLVTDIAGSVAPINHAIKHVDAWAAREKRKVQFPLGLLGARAWVEYQPKGGVGVKIGRAHVCTPVTNAH